MFISALFGFIFGLILGTTEMPWGGGDFPTEEMKGRYEKSIHKKCIFCSFLCVDSCGKNSKSM
jgi:hypothetical protein